MTPTQVINVRKAPEGWRHDPRYQYIGRCGHGFDGYFGNPRTVLEGYGVYLMERLLDDREFREEVRGLAGKTLVCFCKPKPCHGDLLALCADLLAQGVLDQWL